MAYYDGVSGDLVGGFLYFPVEGAVDRWRGEANFCLNGFGDPPAAAAVSDSGGFRLPRPTPFSAPSSCALPVLTRIIRDEPDRDPPPRRHPYRIPLHRVDQIEPGRVLARVEIPEPLPHHEEIEPVQMQGMALCPDYARVLQNDLQPGAERHPSNPRPA
ncbi:neuraminidase [Striga asiatica]|uniref:Neuraminidase n=1 Tax=Striga asiatica TaxID=4170 RepID=A0A5A7P7A4_STRAF|nr:neuraminidase [Striga asiatica]